jgi:hypothetical protein
MSKDRRDSCFDPLFIQEENVKNKKKIDGEKHMTHMNIYELYPNIDLYMNTHKHTHICTA